MIFVTLGSQKFQFNRLLQKIDRLIEEGVVTDEVFAQTGASTYRPVHYAYKAYLDHNQYTYYNRLADTVITHGGSGAIINAVKLHKDVIAVPRLSAYGEHVDDHQLEIVEMFERMNLILACRDVDRLGEVLAQANGHEFAVYCPNTESYILDLDTWLQDHAQGRSSRKRRLLHR